MITLTSRAIALGTIVLAAAALAGCSSSTAPTTAATTASAGDVDLSGVCPATVVVQTDWDPTADHADLFQMLGPNPTIDTSKKAVVGDLYANGGPTGVKLEIRAGGPAIGYQTVSSQMITDPEITLGYGALDSQIATSQLLPTTAIYATYDKSPQVLLWVPATYPDVKTIADIGKTDATVLYYDGANFMSYLTSSGQIRPEQIDGSYDGTPATFVASGGKDVEQGYSTNEPYTFSHEVAAWNKPLSYAYIADAGYPNYNGAIFARTADLPTLDGCLTALVPVIQQAEVDYLADPGPTNQLIVDAVAQYADGFVYTIGSADYAVATAVKDDLLGNGGNDYIGDFDPQKVSTLFGIVAPITAQNGSPVLGGLTADATYTNSYLDTSIGTK